MLGDALLLELLMDWLPKSRVGGDRVKAVESPVVPLSEMTCLPLGALSVTVMLPDREPAAVGVKLTKMLHDAPAAMGLKRRQLSLSVKSPVARILEMAKGDSPPLVRITPCNALAVPTGWLPNTRLAGVRAAPAWPDTLTVGVCGVEDTSDSTT